MLTTLASKAIPIPGSAPIRLAAPEGRKSITAPVSPLSLAAAGLYALVVMVALYAAMVAKKQDQQFWHRATWLLLAGLFILLLVSRIAGLEDMLREALRDTLRSDAAYDRRRAIQRPVAAGLIALASVAVGWGLYRTAQFRKGRRNLAVLAAQAGGFALLFLVALRVISLHPIDGLLYGPLKLNWLADIGASCLVAGAAAYYVKIMRGQRPPGDKDPA